MNDETKRGRGGVRSGAGRPPQLTELRKLTIGAICENAWREAAKATSQRRFADETILPERLADEIRRCARVRGDTVAVREGAGKASFGDRKRLYRLRVRRPYGAGIKEEIYRDAITYAVVNWDVKIGERTVRTCWQRYRDFLATVPE